RPRHHGARRHPRRSGVRPDLRRTVLQLFSAQGQGAETPALGQGPTQVPARVLLFRRSRVWLDARAAVDVGAVSALGAPQWSRISGAAIGQGQDRLRETRQLLREDQRSETRAEDSRSFGDAQVAQVFEGVVAARQSAVVASERVVVAGLLLDVAAR